MTQRIEMTSPNHPDEQISISMEIPDRMIRNLVPYLAMFEALVRNSSFQMRFIPPLRVEREESTTDEHFWLGTPPLGTRLASFLHTPHKILPPIMIAALGAAVQEGWI